MIRKPIIQLIWLYGLILIVLSFCNHKNFLKVRAIATEDIGEDVSDSLQLINTLLDNSKAQEALSIIRQQSEETQKQISYRLALSRVYAQMGQGDESEELINQCMLEDPSSEDSLLLLSRYCLQTKRYDEAEKHVRSLIMLAGSIPSIAQAYAILAKITLLRDGDVDTAKELLMQAIELNPDDDKVQVDYGMLLITNFRNMDEDAKLAFTIAEAINPLKYQKLIAKVYIHYQRYKWAAEILSRLLRINIYDFGDPMNQWNVLSDSYVGAVDDANDIDTESMNLLADCCEILGLFKAAEHLYTAGKLDLLSLI